MQGEKRGGKVREKNSDGGEEERKEIEGRGERA